MSHPSLQTFVCGFVKSCKKKKNKKIRSTNSSVCHLEVRIVFACAGERSAWDADRPRRDHSVLVEMERLCDTTTSGTAPRGECDSDSFYHWNISVLGAFVVVFGAAGNTLVRRILG